MQTFRKFSVLFTILMCAEWINSTQGNHYRAAFIANDSLPSSFLSSVFLFFLPFSAFVFLFFILLFTSIFLHPLLPSHFVHPPCRFPGSLSEFYIHCRQFEYDDKVFCYSHLPHQFFIPCMRIIQNAYKGFFEICLHENDAFTRRYKVSCGNSFTHKVLPFLLLIFSFKKVIFK